MFGVPTIWSDGGAVWCPFVGFRCPWPCPPNCQCPGECPMDVAVSSEDAVQFGTVDATDYGHPFAGAPLTWPCSSSCQCPGGCAMDVDESDATTAAGRDATEIEWLESIDQQHCWSCSVKNGVHEEGQGPADFPASVTHYDGVDAMDMGQLVESTGQQCYWPKSVTNAVYEEQCGFEADFTASHASYGVVNAPDDGHFAFADRQFPSWPYRVTNNVRQAQWSDDSPTYDEVVNDDMCLVGATTDDGSGDESDTSGGVIIIV